MKDHNKTLKSVLEPARDLSHSIKKNASVVYKTWSSLDIDSHCQYHDLNFLNIELCFLGFFFTLRNLGSKQPSSLAA
jgi:hypothetical protein